VRKRRRVTRARLRELLHYDRKTGEFRWLKCVSPTEPGDLAGGLNKDGYLKITINGRRYPAHHLAWFCPQIIDHRDGDPSNNRWTNLRPATRSQNAANQRRHRNNACGLKGVCSNRGGWRATINKDGRRHHLGTFPTPHEAHAAYAKVARKLFGEFARTE